MDGDAQGLDVVATICPAGEVAEIELNLVPPLVEPHRHGADKGLNSSGRLVVTSPETPADVLVVEYLHFEGEVLFQLPQARSTFLMIMTRKGSLMPRVSLAALGHVTKDVVTLVPMISSTLDWMSLSVSRLMCPFSTV